MNIPPTEHDFDETPAAATKNTPENHGPPAPDAKPRPSSETSPDPEKHRWIQCAPAAWEVVLSPPSLDLFSKPTLFHCDDLFLAQAEASQYAFGHHDVTQ